MQDETPEQNFKPLRDVFYITGFIAAVVIGSILINAFVFRTFNVVGASMEPTLHTDERLIVNKIPRTIANLTGREFLPSRGQIIVFRNPIFVQGTPDEYVVKRVVGLPGERVVVKDGTLTVYNKQHPEGFQPDKDWKEPKSPTSGSIDTSVPEHELFVVGDNRIGSFSLDSRSGMGTIPLQNIQGPVEIRIFPFDEMKLF